MTKQTAQRLQAVVSLVGVLGVLGVKLYVIGWLDDWRIVSAAVAVPVGLFALWWWRNAVKAARERDAMNERWESRRTVQEPGRGGAAQ